MTNEYIQRTGTANPFNGINVGRYSTPTFADLDADGDLDALIGEQDGNLYYYKNTGSSTNPLYTEQTGTANPFNAIDFGASSTPTLRIWTEMATSMPLLGNLTVLSTTTKTQAVAPIPFTRSKQEPPTPSMALLLGITAPPPLRIWTQMATLMRLLGNMTVISTTTKIRAVAPIPFTRSKQEPPTPSMALMLGLTAHLP